MPYGSLMFLAPVLLVIAAVLFTLQSFEPAETAPQEPTLPQPRYELRQAQWTRLDEQGQPELRATAEAIDYFDNRSAMLQEVTLDHFGGEGGPWRIDAPLGVVPARESRMRLFEPVTMTGRAREGDPITVKTDLLWVDWEEHEIYTDRPVTLDSAYRQARAVGLRADWDGEHVRLLRNVEVHYAPP